MKRGSITLYLSLTMLVLMSLIFAGLDSERLAAARVIADSTMEQSLFSLFSEYDKDLYETYGLLFLEGGYGTQQLQLGAVLEEIEEYAKPLISPGGNPLGMNLTDSHITGYQLAVDEEGAALVDQISEIMIGKIGVSGIQAISSELTNYLGITNEQQAREQAIDLEMLEQEYLQAKSVSEQGLEYRTTLSEVQQEDLVDELSAIRKLGVYYGCFPDPSSVSGGRIETKGWLTDRTLEKGMGVLGVNDSNLMDKTMLVEFLVESFPCFTDKFNGKYLNYQVEAAIGGKYSDAENLKVVLDQIALIREASNFVYLCGGNAQAVEAEELAAAISAAILMPELEPCIALLVKAGWAYLESLQDIKNLLAGGRVPLAKGESDWQTNLLSLISSIDLPVEETKDSDHGLSYEWYLRMLLFFRSESSLTDSVMDLLEYHERMEKERENFYLDHCICAVEAELEMTVGRRKITVMRSYGYDM